MSSRMHRRRYRSQLVLVWCIHPLPLPQSLGAERATYRSTSLRCTDFVAPQSGIAESGVVAVDPYRRREDESACGGVGLGGVAGAGGEGAQMRQRESHGARVWARRRELRMLRVKARRSRSRAGVAAMGWVERGALGLSPDRALGGIASPPNSPGARRTGQTAR